MKSNKNPYLKTQTEIIKTLLDGSKKTQNMIAEETKYKKSTISHALDDLEKKKVILRELIKIKSGRTNKGSYDNKLCWLTYEVDNGKHILDFLREILIKYPIPISDLQESENVISSLVEKHKTVWEEKARVIEGFKNMAATDNQSLIKSETVSSRIENPSIISDLSTRPTFMQDAFKPEPPISENELHKAKDDFKQKLRLSPKFFKLCLDNEADSLSSDLLKDILAIFGIKPAIFGIKPEHVTNNYKDAAPIFLNSNQPLFNFFSWYVFKCDLIFKVCVMDDLLGGDTNYEAIEYAQKIDEQFEQIISI